MKFFFSIQLVRIQSSLMKSKMKKNLSRLIASVLKSNKKIYKQQERLVNRYQQLSEEQQKQEALNKFTRYLAFGFIIFRIVIFCFNHFS